MVLRKKNICCEQENEDDCGIKQKEDIFGKKDRKRAEWLGKEILKKCRSRLYGRYPMLDAAFSGVRHRMSDQTERVGTDGESIWFDPYFLAEVYQKEPQLLTGGYLHMLLHCMYLHPWKASAYEPDRWDLACDLAVTGMMEAAGEKSSDLTETEKLIADCRKALRSQVLSPEQLYARLQEGSYPFFEKELGEAFAFDDHSFWRKEWTKEERKRLERKWDRIREEGAGPGASFTGRAGLTPGSDTEEVLPGEDSRTDYRSFLRRFCITREELQMDEESFDYIYYNLGMERYGNLPLLEPLEYTEANRLEELVIAIDTSGSCTARMVSDFLQETCRILGEQENFFRKMKVHILQCDCCIQEAAVIHSAEEWKEYSRHITIHGRAGTDFRPVFRYIREQKEQEELKNLKALIYFTDGDGIFPGEKPEYETAFVFTKKTPWMERIPKWAMRLTCAHIIS